MPDILGAFVSSIGRIDLRAVIDILFVAFIIYWLLLLLRGTTAIVLLRALAAVYLLAFFISYVFQLTVVGWLLRNSLPAMLVAIPIVFQPELRRVLEQVGRGFVVWRPGAPNAALLVTVDALTGACRVLAERRTGALIVLERETGLQDYVEQGFPLDAILSRELLISIFVPTSPMHDGAVVIRNGRVVVARCVMPLSDNAASPISMGTRHRAALGISERTDAIAIAVSEERASISVAKNGQFVILDNADHLKDLLISYYAHRNGASSPPRRFEAEEEVARAR